MENIIQIDDGLEVFEIKNKQGKILCQFEFCPSDAGIVSRHKEVITNINNMALLLEKEKISDADKIEKAENYIKEQFDYLFNADVSNSFFSILSPLTTLANGQVFSEHVMESIAKIVEKRTGDRIQKVKIRINKYTKKYHG